MKLFVFEPYEWDYCGGAIGAIANTFEEAVTLIVEEDRRKVLERAEKRGEEDPIFNYKEGYFSMAPNTFRKGHWNQWLLTCTLEVPEEKRARVAFDNWNYS